MANGDQIESKKRVGIAPTELAYKLLDAVTANDSGAWIDARYINQSTVEVSGTWPSAASVQLQVSNAAVKPANNVDGTPVGSPLTAPGLVAPPAPVRWIKAAVTGWSGTGSISANLHALQ